MNPAVQTKLKELIQFAKANGLTEVAWQENGMKIAFRRGVAPAAKPKAAAPVEKTDSKAPDADEQFVRSPMVGTFRRSVDKNRPPIVMVGNHIKPGDRLGVVECMRIPNDVVSFSGGEIKRILVEDGQAVEYGQPLFSVKVVDAPVNGSNGTNGVNGNSH